METKRNHDLTEEELAQVRKAMEDFGNTPVVKAEEESEPPAEPPEKPIKKRKKWIAWAAVAVAVALVIGIGYGHWADLPRNHPNSMAKRMQTISGGIGNGIAAVLNDGTIRMNNTLFMPKVSDWENMQAVSIGNIHAVGLREDGTVTFSGGDTCGEECILWTQMQAVSAGQFYTVGLHEDGTVVAAGRNEYGQCNVSKWKNMIGIAAGTYFTAGLKFDGTVEITEIHPVSDTFASTPGVSVSIDLINAKLKEMASELEAVRRWTDIISISVGEDYILGLKEDGTVVAAGMNEKGQCNVGGWTGITHIDACKQMSIGVRFDGTLVAAGAMSERFPMDELMHMGAEMDIVAACSDGRSNVYLLDKNGILSRMAMPVMSSVSYTRLQITEWFTDVRLP